MLGEKIHPYIHDTVGYTTPDGLKTVFLVTAIRVEQPNESHHDFHVLEVLDHTRNLWIPESDLDVIIHPVAIASRLVQHYQRNADGEWEAV